MAAGNDGETEKQIFLENTPRKSIAELVKGRQVERCIVMSTITTFETGMGWYYLACKVCGRNVQNIPPLVTIDRVDDDLRKFKIYCPRCKRYEPGMFPR